MPKTLESLDSASARYLLALTSPFSEQALGCRVPDPYRVPTVTAKIEVVQTLTADATGNLALALYGNPWHAMHLHIGTTSGPMTTFPSAPSEYYLAGAEPVDFLNVCSAYRIVAQGVQFRNIQAPINIQGRAIFARKAQAGYLGRNVLSLGPGVTTEFLQRAFLTNTITQGLLTLPDSFEVSQKDLADRVCCLNHRPQDPRGLNMVACEGSAGAAALTVNYAAGTMVCNAAGVVQTGLIDIPESVIAGWDGLLMYANGLTASTPVMEVKFIWHIEYSPTFATGTMVADSSLAYANNPHGLQTALSVASSVPFDSRSLREPEKADSGPSFWQKAGGMLLRKGEDLALGALTGLLLA